MDKAYIEVIKQIRRLSVLLMSLVALFAILSLIFKSDVLQNLAFITAVVALSYVTFKVVRAVNSAKK